MSSEKPMGQVIQIDGAQMRDHLGEMIRETVEETLNAMPDAEGGPALWRWALRTQRDSAGYSGWQL